MASIQELQESLAADQVRAVELADKALSAIDTVINAANLWLGILSLGIGLLGVIGLAAVWFGTRRAAVKVANHRVDSYLKTDEGKAFAQAAIADEVERQLRERTLVMVSPPQPQAQEDSFNRDPKESGGAK
ncbi:hypothetical protein [Aurantimonas coralicida]|uniref:hypothetical protein n=1 Tax=Aurantimonas coralicida TaxID=182270 RepID=UPI00239D61E4|nr:hypothetical protein [Aurantimonas coralicida]MDE0921501.1 hypothetical protein [Aurantimonas coralicida]